MIHVEVSAIIHARPEQVYGVISDYRVGHPAILPKPYFQDLVVEKGGQGAGTVIRTTMKVFGVERTFVMTVAEPEPGRVLVEANEDTHTTFTVEPLNGGQHTRLTIVTKMKPSPGFRGFMEKWMNPSIMRMIFNKELQKVEAYLAN